MAHNEVRGFRAGVTQKLGWYVYRLVDPVRKETFYIGKGKGDRVFDHFNEADNGARSEKAERIRQIWENGRDAEIIIHRHGLTEDEAFLVEAALIDFLPNVLADPASRANKVRGQHTDDLGAKTVDVLNHQYAARPAAIEEPMALIKINRRWLSHYKARGAPPDNTEIYEMVRGHWKVAPSRHKKVNYAAAVAFGLIRQVYEIVRWSPKDENGRVSFEGRNASSKSYLVGTHVNDFFRSGAQAPVRWLYPDVS